MGLVSNSTPVARQAVSAIGKRLACFAIVKLLALAGAAEAQVTSQKAGQDITTAAIVVGKLAPDIVTTFEFPPTAVEVAAAMERGVRVFEFDLDAPGAEAALGAVKAGGGQVTAYHVGGGGGRDWGSVRTGEWVRRYDSPRDFHALTEDVRRLVKLGASHIHFDNTHRMSGRRLESIADAIVAGGAGFVAKNNPDKWDLVMKRRADLKPAYAIVEDAMFDADATQSAGNLWMRGVPVYIVGFRRPLRADAPAVTDDYAKAYLAANPWARVLVIDDERAWDSRTGSFVR